MKSLRQRFFPTLFLIAGIAQSVAAEPAPEKRSSVGAAIRDEFKYQPNLRSVEDLPPFAAADSGTSDAEIIRLPNFIVREAPDTTMRDLDLALAQREKLSSGALIRKDLGRRVRFEALLPVWLDANMKNDRVLRFDVFRLAW